MDLPIAFEKSRAKLMVTLWETNELKTEFSEPLSQKPLNLRRLKRGWGKNPKALLEYDAETYKGYKIGFFKRFI